MICGPCVHSNMYDQYVARVFIAVRYENCMWPMRDLAPLPFSDRRHPPRVLLDAVAERVIAARNGTTETVSGSPRSTPYASTSISVTTVEV